MPNPETNVENGKAVDEMAEQELYHLKRAAEIERRLTEIQHSTRVDVPELAGAHDYLRMKYPWYYQWHMKQAAHTFHYIFLALYLLAWIYLIIFR